MPNRDGTGPQGNGSMTGRKQGRCNPNKDNIQDTGRGLGLRKRATQ